ncbi:extracellular solute-binding protein [Candidatus Microgenomates bacterium]|nr:extracellular solute-binding protein [Candidatus Microgenomates bacterium]
MAFPDQFPVQDSSFPPIPPASPTPAVPPVSPAGPTSTQPPDFSHPLDGEKKSFLSRLPLKMILIVIAVLAVLGGGFVAFTKFFPSAKPVPPVNLTWWGLWEDDSLVTPLIEEYQKAHPNIKISYIKQSQQDYRERLTSALARGEGPDIFRFHNSWVPMMASELAVVPPGVMSLSDFQNRFYPVAVADLTRNNQILGIPLMIDGLGLYINTDIFQQAGLTPPITWDELRSEALALTIRDEQQNITRAGVALGNAANVDHWQDILSLMMLQNGADMASPISKNAEDSLTFYTIFATTDKVWDETLPPSTVTFASGKVAMYFGPSWEAFNIKAQNPNLHFQIVPVPQVAKATPDQKDLTWASYWVEGVWARSKNVSESYKFLKFLSDKEFLEKLYSLQAKMRLFGEPYPRPDMADLLSSDPTVGAFIKEAPFAKSWYLASRTNDGPTGINSRISKYFEDAINKVLQGGDVKEAMQTVAQGVSQVLSSYGTR